MDKFPSRERSAAASLEMRVTAVVVVSRVAAKPSGRSPLELCLRSVLAESWIDDLVIVDHANEPAVSSWLRALQADRRDVEVVVCADDVASAAAAANLGAAKARGRWLLFLDSWVVLQRGAAARLASAGNNARAPWVVGGRLTDRRGRDCTAARAGAPSTFSAVAIALGWPAATSLRRRRRSSGPTAVGAISGALMLMPRDAFDALDGFDAGFATDAADLDFCRRAKEAGGSVLFQPAAAGIKFDAGARSRRQVQGLALFAARSAKTPLERAFAAIAWPALYVLLALKEFVAGRPPRRH